jgi:hypothetical protein
MNEFQKSSMTRLLAFLLAVVFSAGLSASAQTSGKRSVSAIASRAEFDQLSRVYHSGTQYALPHMMFVIDRRDKNKIYYVNSKRYTFHKDFVNGTYLSLERGDEFFRNNYLNSSRRFILGTVAYQTPVKRWTFEFWEGDLIEADQMKLAYDVINKSFFEPVAYKPNSLRQEEASAAIQGIQRVLQSDIAKEREYQPLNMAKGIGRVHIIEKIDDRVEIGSNEILILNEVPVQLPPVAGIITSQPSTPLSHINLLAKGWGVPNAYIKDAQNLFREFDGRWIILETKGDVYTIKPADNSALDEYQKRLLARRDLMTPRSDLSVKRLASLREQRRRDIIAYGGKSANLGEVMNSRMAGITVPNGFAIPFFYYDQFIKENDLEEPIFEMMNDQRFVHDPSYRRERLTQMRERIQQAKVSTALTEAVVRKLKTEYAGKGVFVRSSSNSEDLPNFSGAGIYSTVPNVREHDKVIEAVKTVWASLWNFEAYEARERAGIEHSKVYMAVLIQEGINSDSSGVMITTDPYDRENNDAIYISAKRGLGIKVVEGKRIAEQILFRPRSNSVKVLTRSDEDSLLVFDDKGGLKEVPISGDRNVLTDDVVRRLARAAAKIKRVFGGKNQDIEWAYMRGQIYVIQSRAYVVGG